MRSVFGLLTALAGLFLVWLWFSGRFDAAWNAIKGGATSATTTTAGANPASNITPNQLQTILNAGSLVQVTPPYIASIPQYVAAPTAPTAVNTTGLV